MKLVDISYYVKDKIDSNSISLEEYVTTESLLPNKEGIEIAQKLPPPCKLTHFKEGDILLSNIRPYLKKIWMANFKGGCSSDVIVFRVKEGYSPHFLYSILLQDSFFNYIMNSVKGSKMPRGNKDEILNFEFPIFSFKQQENIGGLISILNKKIALNKAINHNLAAMAKQLYDYWFVQFDFPNEEGKPYKSSGGKMVWNEKLKREIPEGWKISNLDNIGNFKNGINYSKKDIGNNKYKIVNVRNISSSSIFIDNNELDEILLGEAADNYIISDNDILIARSGIPGATRILRDYEKNIIYSGFIICFSVNNIYYKNKLFFDIKMLESTTKNQSNGSILSNISQDILKQLVVVIPATKTLESFNNISLLFSLICNKQREIYFLTKQRDELLPLLMNGQARIG